jgi:iron complex transport system substrate-binding protein
MSLRVKIIPFILLCALFEACAPPAQDPVVRREFTDGIGRTVAVPERVERIISLAPSLTEMVYAAGAGDRLVGVTTFCNYPPEAAAIEKVSDTQTPNIERIIALRPDVVLVTTASQLEAFASTLGERRIAVYVSNAETADAIFSEIEQLGRLFGTDSQARGRAAELRDRFRVAAEEVSDAPRPRVFLQISNEPLFTIGRASFLTDVIEKAGGTSVTREVETAYPKLSKETAAAMDPDVILLSDSEDNSGPNAVFAHSKAVRDGKVYQVNADLISRPGPRIVEALELIARVLHPERFN